MQHRSALRTSVVLSIAMLAVLAVPAQAQFRPRPLGEPATGEQYHVEGSASLWFPAATVSASSESFGIPGTLIDFKNDLGLQDTRFADLRLVLRPTKSSKFRFQFIPVKYNASSVLRRTLVFNGQRYDIGLPVKSTLDWRAYRFAYEFDFISKNRGYAGFIVEAKYTDVKILLDASPFVTEFAQARAPIPAIGGVGRFYVVPNIGVTFELTGFR